MGAFDTALTPVDVAPADTNNATLFTAATDSSVMVDITNQGVADVLARVGVTPSGGANAWRIFDALVLAGDALLRYGPVFLQAGDAIVVRTDTTDDVVFSLDGVEST